MLVVGLIAGLLGALALAIIFIQQLMPFSDRSIHPNQKRAMSRHGECQPRPYPELPWREAALKLVADNRVEEERQRVAWEQSRRLKLAERIERMTGRHVEPGDTVTVDGVEFGQAGDMLVIYGKCPRCGQRARSQVLMDWESIGYVLECFSPDYKRHICLGPQAGSHAGDVPR